MVLPRIHDAPQAIQMLQAAGIPVLQQFYGFSIVHPKTQAGCNFIACGRELADGSIRMTVSTEERPPRSGSFSRFDFCEMAELVIAAYRCAGENPTRSEIVRCLREVDQEYDEEVLQARLTAWNIAQEIGEPNRTPRGVPDLRCDSEAESSGQE